MGNVEIVGWVMVAVWRIACIALSCLVSLPLAYKQASAQAAYPTQNINIQVSSAAGGVTDIVARLVWQKLSEAFGRAVIFEIRAGAGGNLAARAVSTATPDGHTILATTTAIAINETAYKNKG